MSEPSAALAADTRRGPAGSRGTRNTGIEGPMDNMNRGAYVVSSYLSPSGLSAFTARRHDQNVALWHVDQQAVTLVRYWEIERLSGIKHHPLPLYDARSSADLLDILLAQEGLTRADVSEIWGTPGLEVNEVLPAFDRRGLPAHSLAHLFSGLCMDSDKFQESDIIALAMDAAPDFLLESTVLDEYWYAGAISRKGSVTVVPVESPGQLWSAAERLLEKEPGTLMALAHATPVAIDHDVEPLIARRYWGGHRLSEDCVRIVKSLIEAAERVITTGSGEGDERFSREELVASAVSKIVQSVSTTIAERNVEMLLEQSGFSPQETYLSMSGGFALNCPTNSHLLSLHRFRGLLIPPCANDSGQALGIGLMGFHARGDLTRRRVATALPYAGECRLGVEEGVARWDKWILDVRDFDPETFVADLRRRPVAWVDGAAEVGPRALGHRSLLGDPRTLETKHFLNEVKQRQWWRPVAPIVLEECVADWFVDGRPSPFMLETFQLAPDKRHLVPAIVHLDGSARIQTLSDRDEPFLAKALRAWQQQTEVPIICNTSLNDRGEPIVNSASDALNLCVRKGIEVAYIGRRRYLLDIRGQAPGADGPEERPLNALFAQQDSRPAALFDPSVDPNVMYLLYFWPTMHKYADSPSGLARLRSVARRLSQQDSGYEARARRFMDRWRNALDLWVTPVRGSGADD
ncbi:carbamoyltransferase C-terminal domain-containing protein [Streptomyces sp. NPDC002588]|uniref:carbamoyltransferase C-terminal domain-containing protein n=1 Tax=Streptomyces sp. NPDC002588 TaxID=3154419 RepID=UPI003317E8B4